MTCFQIEHVDPKPTVCVCTSNTWQYLGWDSFADIQTNASFSLLGILKNIG